MPYIIGTTIYLRDYRMEDLDSIYEWRNLEEITRTLPSYVWPESLDQTRSFLEAQVKNTDPNNRKFVICSHQDDRYLGHIGYEKDSSSLFLVGRE
jgi:RimJ/RimL family protein N-acetyltransferase